MNISHTMLLAVAGLVASIAACGPPTAHSSMESQTTSTTASGAETHTRVSETTEQGNDGNNHVVRTETTDSTSPAPSSH